MRRADEGDPAGRYIWFIPPRRLLAITSVDIDRPLHNVSYNKQQLGSDWWDDMLKGHPATSGHNAQFNSMCLTRRRRAPTASCTRLQIKWWQLKFLQTTDSFLRVRVIQNYVDIFPINVISLLHESLRPDRKSGGGEEPRMQFAVVHFNICELDTSRCFQGALKTFSNCVCCKKNLTESQDPFRHIF